MWSDIRTSVRYLVGDIVQTGKDIFTYGSSDVFTLTESNVVAVVDVMVNDVGSSITYSYNEDSNKVTLGSGLSVVAGDTIEVDYTYYSNYSDTEIDGYIRSAIVHLSTHNYYDFVEKSGEIYPALEKREENIIAAVAAVLMKPENKSYRLPDISIAGPLQSDLPIDQKVARIIAIFKKDNSGLFFNA